MNKYTITKLLTLMIIISSILSDPVYNAISISKYMDETASGVSVTEASSDAKASEVTVEENEGDDSNSKSDAEENQSTSQDLGEIKPLTEEEIASELKEAKFHSQCSFNRGEVYELSETDELPDKTADETKTFSNPRIDKEILSESSNNDGILQPGETVTYGVCIDNPSNILMSHKVKLRDSLVENLPPQFTYNFIGIWANKLDFYKGSLESGGIEMGKLYAGEWVYFKYSITYRGGAVPYSTLENKVVWDGSNPSGYYCDNSGGYKPTSDCESIMIGADGGGYGGDLYIEKQIVSESGVKPGVWEVDEQVTYRVKVTNFSPYESAYNISVRDSMLESMSPGFSLVSGPSVSSPYGTSGSLMNGTFTISSLGISGGVNNSATIDYTIKYNGGVADNTVVKNVATDNGVNPSNYMSTCVSGPGAKKDAACQQLAVESDQIKPPSGETDLQVSKDIVKQSIDDDDNFEIGEKVSYQIIVKNFGEGEAKEIRVRDSLLANLPSELELVGKVNVSSPDSYYNGSLEDDNFEIQSLGQNESVVISYELEYNGGFKDGYRIDNVVTTDGSNPSSITTCNPVNGFTLDVDCEELSALNNEYSNLTKEVTDRGDNVAKPGEYLYYTVNYQTNKSGDVILYDNPDSSVIDEKSIKLISASADGNAMKPSDYQTGFDSMDNSYIAFERDPGTNYEFVYYMKVLDDPAKKESVVNKIKESENGKSATAAMPTDFTSKSNVVLSVADETKDGIAQPEEYLEYSINYLPGADGTAIITDVLDDPNIKNEYRNVRVLEDGKALSGDRYSTYANQIIITNTKEGSKYTIIFNAQVADTVNTSYSTISNTVIATTSSDSSSVTDSIAIPVISSPIVDSPAMSFSVNESSDDSDGDGIAEPGEYLHYDLSFNSKIIRNRNFIAQLDKNLDLKSLKNFQFKANGSIVNIGDYTIDIDHTTNTIVLSYANKVKNEQINISFDIAVKDPLADDEQTVIISSASEVTSGVFESSKIALSAEEIVPEKETLMIDVIGSQNVKPGDSVRMRVTLPSLITETDTLNILSPVNSQYLQFVEVNDVYVNGSSITNSDWSNDNSKGLDLTINRNLQVGTKIEVQFTIQLKPTAPVNSSFAIGVWGQAGEYETGKDVVYISSGSNNVSNSPDVFVDFTIASEAGGSVSNQIEAGENIIYELSLENMSDETIVINITDALHDQHFDNVFSWFSDDVVSVISSMSGLEDEYTMSQLESGITLSIEPSEIKLVRFVVTGKEVMEELDINPVDGDPDEKILNVIEISQSSKSKVYPGSDIALPYMNGELTVGKRASTSDGDNVLSDDGSEDIAYKITVVNKGTREARGVFVQDKLEDQQIDLIADTTNLSSIPVTSSGNGDIITENPTVGTLMGDSGIEVSIPAGDYITLQFDIPSKPFDTDSIDIDADGTPDIKFVNTATAYDSTNKTSYPETAAIYFKDPLLGSVKYKYTNELGDDVPLIEGFDMVNTLSVTLADDTDYISGFISYDNRYLNDVRRDNIELSINGTITNVPIVIDYVKQGNTTTATFMIAHEFKASDKIELVVFQSPKDALYDNTSLRYSVNNARLFVDNEKTDVYMDSFELI